MANQAMAVRFTDKEKQDLVELAARFHRSQADILRVLVGEALAVLKDQDAQVQPKRRVRQAADHPTRAREGIEFRGG